MSGRYSAAQLAIIKQMSGQLSFGSAGDYQADERARVALLIWRLSSRRAGRCRVAQLTIIKQMSGQVREAHLVIIKQMNGQVSPGSVGDYQADDWASVARLSWR